MLLDEPTTGLDPHARQLLWEMMSSLKAAGVTQVLTTHYMEEAQQIADRVIIIDGGKIVAHGTPASLIRSHCKAERIVMYFSSSDAARTAQLCLQAGDVEGNSLVIACERSQPALATIDALAQPPDRVVVRPSNLEDVFFAMTGRDLQQCET
jgi:lipooligosaccharide transport system ATP-binding protein